MSIEAILLFVGVAIIAGAIALYLIVVAAMLNHVSFTVGTVLVGVRSIAHQTAPIGAVIKDMARDVADVESSLDALVLYADEADELASPAPRAVSRGAATT